MSETSARVRIDGEPYLSRAKAYRDAHFAHAVAWTEFAKSYGADGYPLHGRGLNFSHGKAPAGWTKPKSPSWHSHPKKGHPDEAVLAAFREQHPAPTTHDIFGGALCFNLSYDGPGQASGGGLIGFFINGAIVGWAGDVFTAIIPDAEVAVRSLKERQPDAVPREPAASWRLPAGLTRITKAEDALIYAQAAVDAEREEAA